MHTGPKILVSLAVLVLSLDLFPIYAQQGQPSANANAGNTLVGRWEIYQTKVQGRPYLKQYKGRPFVSIGPNAFTVIYEYGPDGSFKRITRIDGRDTEETGKWVYSGSEMRLQLDKGRIEEVFYVRFDDPKQITVVEVYEDTTDPGIFAQFRRIKSE
jgi:hypothetical protein